MNAFEVLKEAVPVEEYASSLTELRSNGRSLRGACPIHGGSNPSAFAVNVEHQKFRCFGCGAHGDVIDLCQHVENHDQMWTAVHSLAQRYSIELPERPPSWYQRQDEKAKVRKQVQEVLTRSYQRRFFRVYGDVILEGIDEPTEREEEARRIFDGFYRVARHAARCRLERQRV